MRKALIGLALFLVGVALPGGPDRRITRRPAQWARKTPAEVGMDAAKLNEAVEFMKTHETASPRRDFSDQEIVNGKLLASMPTERGRQRRPDHPPRLHRRGVRAIRCVRIRPTAWRRACWRRSPALRSIAG